MLQTIAAATQRPPPSPGHLDRVTRSVNGRDLFDPLGEPQQPSCILDMKAFDQLAFDQHNTLACGRCRGVRGDDAARPLGVRRTRREGGVRRSDLRWVDHGLAIEAQLAALPADKGKAFLVGEIEMDAVEDGKPVGGYDDFLTGWMLDENSKDVWGRPVGLLVLADGSMLITDDGANKIWRLTYHGK